MTDVLVALDATAAAEPVLRTAMTALWRDDAKWYRDWTSFTPFAELRETHSAIVFLVGARAYKLKKPVSLEFLDYSTPQRRLDACRREFTLNRRLAPDVYLGVTEIPDLAGGASEPVLVMRRMPAERRLASLIRSGADVEGGVRQIARLLAGFHSRCARSSRITAQGSRDALWQRWNQNFLEARPYVGDTLDPTQFDEVRSKVDRYLSGRGPLFADRASRRAIVDGHGDLLADDIFCLDDGPRILDCLEFDDRLRYLDGLDDVACLAMDLEHLGSAGAAQELTATYLELGGDNAPTSLLHHYIAYRAFMRAKVTCLPGAHTEGPGEPGALMELASGHLSEAEVQLILVGGAPGTGKTSLAAGLADALGCTVISSDRVRKELAGVPGETPMPASYQAGIYSSDWTDNTYAELVRRADLLLSLGETVVLDATWASDVHRSLAQDLAQRTASPLIAYRCELPDEFVNERIAGRGSVSDADAAIAAEIRSRFDDWPESITVDTREPVDAVVARLRRHSAMPGVGGHEPAPFSGPTHPEPDVPSLTRLTRPHDPATEPTEHATRQGEITMHTKTWQIQVYLYEQDGRTRAEAVLRTDAGTELRHEGTALRKPGDRDIPEIGDELATCRALAGLAHDLLDATISDVQANDPAPGELRIAMDVE